MIESHRYTLALGGLVLSLAASILLAATIGSVPVSPVDALGTIGYGMTGMEALSPYGDSYLYDILWSLRLPRIVLAVCVGMGLSVCGAVMQAIVRNPLADPYILGVSSGASLGATAAVLLGIGTVLGANFVGIVAAAGAFAVAIGALLLSDCGSPSNSVKLLLSGMVLNAICSAFASFIIYFANNRDGMQTITFWLMGSLANARWDALLVLFPVVFCGTLFFCTQSRVLDLMLVGDESAITLGTDLGRYRHVYLVVASLLIGFLVCEAGVIGFVGLIVPHAVRMLTGSMHRRLLPFCALGGGIFLIWADVLCRSILPRTELPIGILISMVGAPAFAILMIRSRYGAGGKGA